MSETTPGRRTGLADLHANSQATENLISDALLGHLLITTVPDTTDGVMPYSYSDLEDALSLTSLPTSIMPNRPRPVDAFRRATQMIEGQTTISETGNRVNFLRREVSKDGGEVLYGLVAEEVDSKGETLHYETVANLHFFPAVVTPGGERLLMNVFSGISDAAVERKARAIIAELESAYLLRKSTLDAAKVRGMVRDALRGMHALPIKDSVQFIPIVNEKSVKELAGVLRAIGASAFTIPIGDASDQMAMITQALDQRNTQQIDELLGDIGSGKVTTLRSYTALLTRFGEISKRSDLYQKSYNIRSAADAGRLAAAQQMLLELSKQVSGTR